MRWALLALLATPAAAERFDCRMATGQHVIFEIDPSMFVNEFNANEPIARTITTVRIDGDEITSEPFRLGPLRGFSFDDVAGGTTMCVVTPDGVAVMTNRRADTRIDGICETE